MGNIILSFLCIMLQSSLINDSMNVVIEVFDSTRGWSQDTIRMFSSICSILSVFGAAIWGGLSSRKTVRLSWTCSLLVTAVACFLWANVSSLAVFFVCLAVSSIGGMGFAYIANLNVISNWFPKKKGLAMGWVTIGFPLSAAVSANFVGTLVGMGHGDVQYVYYFYATMAVIMAILVFALVRDYPEQMNAFPDNDSNTNSEKQQKKLAAGLEYMKTSPWTVKKMLSTPLTWKMGFSLGVMELLSLGIMTNFVPRCIQTFGSDEGYGIAIKMLAIAGICACVGSYVCGVIDAKIGPKKAIIVTLIAGIIAILLNVTNIVPVMYVSLIFLAFMLGGASNYLVSLTNTIWGRYDFPPAYKVLKPIVAIIGALGISVVGIIGQNVSYRVSYGVLAVLAVLSMLVIFTVSENRIGREDD